ncbi:MULTISPECIES: Cu(I)-responsive transcriptional regulator [Aeromonas]|uniref:Cu(I)-responsive transcriptional regulator n=1 Tax=Aeromonas TaxID=642 RepID=UPI00036EA109|nr:MULTISPECIES: Cu(I)-responsive transcriptional regulator [Aeromonas]MBL0526811.1 Cu(I)-responsive transcriptional regulator [Aeromonas dhakensis]MBQ4664745.1 Cu(I)-responsive transcriptional regulator [Aeromonas hydrophila]MBQ4712930.1 Cu(I)-responsive transcriptional regulator [Aeromonas hydrophila]MBW3825072.1 Cu(I)-responsive transcriptional regulator [Aeromonas hydrophila]MBW5270820.1 Cu(I)-responsive transcriptional regulator [Aeromonas hydrophila]
MNISKVAKATGLTAKTIRYYESIGLISAPVRSDNGYRSYTEGALRELRFVKRARETGFNLEECQELLALYRDEHRTSAQVKKLAQEKIVDLRSRIAGLQAMLSSLEGLVGCCHGDENPECPILDELERG